MDQRAEIILENIICHYIDSAEPVGSRALSKMTKVKMSAATIRNIMADLTERGFISQPHISSGRIPTDSGYRYYINKLLTVEELRTSSLSRNNRALQENRPSRLEDILLETTKELSKMTDCTSVIISPQPTFSKLRKIEFIRLNAKQILVVLITQIGMVHNNIIHLRKSPSQKVLNKMSHILCELFKGETITNIKKRFVQTLAEKQDRHDKLLAQTIRIGKRAFDAALPSELFILGRSKMCSFPEFSDQNRLRVVYKVLEDKKALHETLVNGMQSTGIQIKIGNENQFEELDLFTIIADTYGNRDSLLGSIGVIGPTRIDYPRVISAIGYTADQLSHAVGQFLEY